MSGTTGGEQDKSPLSDRDHQSSSQRLKNKERPLSGLFSRNLTLTGIVLISLENKGPGTNLLAARQYPLRRPMIENRPCRSDHLRLWRMGKDGQERIDGPRRVGRLTRNQIQVLSSPKLYSVE